MRRMKIKTKKAVYSFLLFLLIVAIFGAVTALCNQWLKESGNSSKFLKLALLALYVLVNYKAWRWLCRKLDNLD